MEYQSNSPAETERLGAALAATLPPGSVAIWGRARPPLSGGWPPGWGVPSG